MSKTVTERFLDLLRAEKAALRNGDYDALSELEAEKELLASKMDQIALRDLPRIGKALAHNATLLTAARSGVNDVVVALRKQHEARTTLTTYNSAGEAAQISRLSGGTERRF